MGIEIGNPQVNWAEYAKQYKETVDSNQDKYRQDMDKLLQGLGLTATEYIRSKQNENWNKYLATIDDDTSYDDIYKMHMKIFGGY